MQFKRDAVYRTPSGKLAVFVESKDNDFRFCYLSDPPYARLEPARNGFTIRHAHALSQMVYHSSRRPNALKEMIDGH
jgi:hypothetical protein